MADPALQRLIKQRRQAAGAGNEKRFSNLTNQIREMRGASPLSDAQKARMFQRQSAKFGPDNTTFQGRPRPGLGQLSGSSSLGQLSGSRLQDMQQYLSKGTGFVPDQGRPAPAVMPGGGRTFGGPMNNMAPDPRTSRAVLFKDGGEVESMSMGERPYKEEKGKKNIMRGVGKAVQGTKFKGVF